MMDVKVYGTKELAALLQRAARSLTNKEITEILQIEVKPLRDIARQDAASMVNPKKKTYKLKRSGQDYTLQPGMLSKSIGTKTLRKSKTPIVIVAPLFKKSPDKDPWFSHFIHEGTKERKNRGSIQAVRFMERANEQKGAAADRVANRMLKKLEEIGL